MNTNDSVTRIMSTDLITVNKTTSCSEIKVLLEEYEINHVPVEKQGKLVGIISSVDVFGLERELGAVEFANPKHTASKLMNTQPVSIHNKMTIKQAAAMLAKQAFNSLPVIDDNQNLVGIVTTHDFLRYMSEDS